MYKEKIKVVAIIDGKVKIVDVENDYQAFKDLLGFESPITIAERKIGNNYYDIWLDDEGLFKEEKIMSACCTNAHECLVGNILIANHKEDETTSLSESDIVQIIHNLMTIKENKNIEYNTSLGLCNVLLPKNNNILIYKI